jgi:uncharacterized Zn finger protein
MDQVRIQVQGSAPEPYELVFQLQDGLFTASCSCAAGIKGDLCKHRLGVLTRGTSATGDGEKILSMYSGSPAEKALLQVAVVEQELSAVQQKLRMAKKTAALILAGRTKSR